MRAESIILLASALFLLSCVRPSAESYFVKAERAHEGVYSFSLDLSDSLSVNDIYFYSSVKCPGMGLTVLWTGPDGRYFSETVYMTGDSEMELYRKDVSMKTPGIWKLDVRVSDEPDGFTGLGIQRECNGTR